jgi:hypothetical protein
MQIDNIFINPCHGNEPYILGANIAKNLSERLEQKQGFAPTIIMPDLYGERQRRILKEEGLVSEKMVFDKRIGNTSKPLLFANADFNKNLINVLAFQEDIQRTVRYELSKYSGSIIEINTGAMYTSEELSFFAYPITYTELFEETWCEEELVETIDLSNLEICHNIMQKVEQDIDLFFIPSYNPFSYQSERRLNTRKIATPPLKPMLAKDLQEIQENSVYVMFSGTGTQTGELSEVVRKLEEEGRNVIIPYWVNKDMDIQRAGPNIINNSNLTKVIGRAGWGIIWTCQNAGTKFEHLPYIVGDEPEIYFNIETLETVPMLEATKQQEQQFGNLNGINYTANAIFHFLE